MFTGWQQDQGKQQILDFIATGIPFNGIWTSGIDNVKVVGMSKTTRFGRHDADRSVIVELIDP